MDIRALSLWVRRLGYDTASCSDKVKPPIISSTAQGQLYLMYLNISFNFFLLP
jgi:hypothetical protein